VLERGVAGIPLSERLHPSAQGNFIEFVPEESGERVVSQSERLPLE